jgi:hypothetical protein
VDYLYTDDGAKHFRPQDYIFKQSRHHPSLCKLIPITELGQKPEDDRITDIFRDQTKIYYGS